MEIDLKVELNKNEIECEYIYDININNYILKIDIKNIQNVFNSISEFLFDKYSVKINYYNYKNNDFLRLFIQDKTFKTKEEELKKFFTSEIKIIIESLIKISFNLSLYKFELLEKLENESFEIRENKYNEFKKYRENQYISEYIDLNEEIKIITNIKENKYLLNELKKYFFRI